jgi:CheY-like chemotaxis protein
MQAVCRISPGNLGLWGRCRDFPHYREGPLVPRPDGRKMIIVGPLAGRRPPDGAGPARQTSRPRKPVLIHSPSVLVVDDEPDTAHTTADILRLLGFRTRAAVTPLDAVRAAAADPPDVVLMDLHRPDVSGFDLARHLRWMAPWRPLLVALTGMPGSEARARAEGFDMYVPKPADPNQLAALLRRAFRDGADGPAVAGGAY